MVKIRELQKQTESKINWALGIIDKIYAAAKLLEDPNGLPFINNPIRLEIDLLKMLGVPKDEVIEFLAKTIGTVIAPTLEVSVKAILLSNLKKMVSCTIDPRIPDEYRKKNKAGDRAVDNNTRGMEFSVASIDLFGQLSINPLSDKGRLMYFGLDGIEDVYKLARADDFDAFLWFVKTRGRFPMASPSATVFDGVPYNATNTNQGNVLKCVTLTADTSGDNPR